jgi:RNA polymerase sigma factor (TIGR02999 family)
MSAEAGHSPGEVTLLLAAAREGDRGAYDRLVPLVYDELRDLADRELRRERGARTLQPTALVHELWLKLASSNPVPASSRTHFLAVAARAMRQVLVDQARRRRAGKRGGDWQPTTLDEGSAVIAVDPDELLALHEALESLEPRQRQVVELKYFGGLEYDEIAELLDSSQRTVRREWTRARARLYRKLYGGAPEQGAANDSSSLGL